MKNKKETFYTILFKDSSNSESTWKNNFSENYIHLLEILVRSLQFFSTRKIIIFTDLELPFDFPNMEVIEIKIKKDLPLSNRFRQPNDLSNDLSVSYNYHKMEKSLQLLKEGYEKVVWIDSDIIATKYIDDIWGKDIENLNYPLTKRHVYQYIISHQNGKTYSDVPWMDCEKLSGDLMEYLEVKKATLWYSFFSFFLSHKNCISFWEEVLDSYRNCLNDNVFMPYDHESFLNVMLWKYNASISISEDLSCIDLDPNLDCPFDLDDLFNNDSKSIERIEHGNAYFSEWLCVPQNKRNILFIHGVKKPKTAECMFEKYISDIVLKHG
jgi:hypothetical protein